MEREENAWLHGQIDKLHRGEVEAAKASISDGTISADGQAMDARTVTTIMPRITTPLVFRKKPEKSQLYERTPAPSGSY